MKWLCLVLLVALPAAAHAAADSPVGIWHTIDDKTGKERGVVELHEADGQIVGTVVATTDPAEGRHVCERCTGAQKDKPIIGLTFMWGLHPDGTEWDGGWILDPETGAVYHCNMHLEDGGRSLVVRGYLGVSLFGRSQTWHRDR
jgi:uncharacterized protein (DUF2147 family)